MEKSGLVVLAGKFIGLLLLSVGWPVWAAVEQHNLRTRDAGTLRLLQPSRPVETRLRDALKLPAAYAFRLQGEDIDEKGRRHRLYQQYYAGVPVQGGDVRAHIDGSGRLYGINGFAESDLEQSVSVKDAALQKLARFNAIKQAKAGADAYLRSASTSPTARFADKHFSQVEIETVIETDDNNIAHDAYLISYLVESKTAKAVAQPYFVIDADTGAVLRQWNGLQTVQIGTGPGGNPKVGFYEYGTNRPSLDVDTASVPGMCTMESPAVRTYNLRGYWFPLFSGRGYGHRFNCARNTDKIVNGALSPINDAHYHGTVVHDMYLNWFGAPPLASVIELMVHHGVNDMNAFWNGLRVNFGDGDGITHYPFATALDVVSHEISHGVTGQHSKLNYFDQSGGINEAFSDMAGEAAEFFVRDHADWLVGMDITTGNKPMRYFTDPAQDGDSIALAANYRKEMDVHYSSGVFNRAFYLLATSSDWNPRKAFEVFFDANRYYWTRESGFTDAACGVLDATADRNYDINLAIVAFRKVGIVCPQYVHLEPDLDDDEKGTDPEKADSDGDRIFNAFDPFPRDANWLGFRSSLGTRFASMAGANISTADIDGDGYVDIIVGLPHFVGRAKGYFLYPLVKVGAVFVYSGRTGEQIWALYGEHAGSLFGYAVKGTKDLNGDGVDDFLVGSPGAKSDKGAVRAGAVYAYSTQWGYLWSESRINTFYGQRANARLGTSVASVEPIIGSWGGEKPKEFGDIVLGAPGQAVANARGRLVRGAGAVYVYNAATGHLVAEVPNPNPRAGDNFGATVAGIGKFAGAGYDNGILVGAPGMDSNGKDAGSVFPVLVYGSVQYLPPIVGSGLGHRFGSSMAPLGDVDGNGINDFAAGTGTASRFRLRHTGELRVCMSQGNATDPISCRIQYGAAPNDFFGGKIAGLNDVNGDGRADLLVSASGHDVFRDVKRGKRVVKVRQKFTGMVQVLSGATGDVIGAIEGMGAGNRFGTGIATGDINGDGVLDSVLGASAVPMRVVLKGGRRVRWDKTHVIWTVSGKAKVPLFPTIP